MRKALFVFVILAALCAVPAHAQTNGYVSTWVWSDYLGANGAVFHDGAHFSYEVGITTPGGFHAAWWHGEPASSTGSMDFGREVDPFNLGWAFRVGGVDVDLSGIWVDAVPLDSIHNDFLCGSMKASKTFNLGSTTLSPFLKVDRYWTVDKADVSDGVHGFVGAVHTWPLSNNWTLTNELKALYDWTTFSAEEGCLAFWAPSLAYTWGHNTLGFNAKLSEPLTVDDRSSQFIYGLSYTRTLSF